MSGAGLPRRVEPWLLVGYYQDMQTTQGGYLTRIEAAERAHVHPRTITRWITEGHLAKHPGRRGRRQVTLVSIEELDALTAVTVETKTAAS